MVQAQSVATPTGLAAKPGDAQVKLTWDDPSDNTITGYDYQQKKEGDAAFGSWTTIPQSAPTNANALSYTATGLTNGIEYTFRLRVRNPVGTSSESNEATTTPWPKPAKPEGFEVTPQNGQVWLTWDRSDDPSITGWQYWLRKGANIAVDWQDIDNCDTGTDGCVDDGDANTIAYLVTGLENGLTDESGTSGGKDNRYRFKLRAKNPTGLGTKTEPTLSAAPQSSNVNQPLKPRGFSAIVRGAQATLTWYDPNDATIEKYQYRRYHSDPWKDIDPSGSSTVTAAVTTNGRNEELRIRSVYPGNVNSPESERAAESNKAPEFSEGETTTRFVFSETPADQPIGVPVTATDAASFTIDTDNGQLKTSADLDHATKSSYTVTVSVHDGKTSFGSYAQSVTGTNAIDDTIEVTITVKLAEPPAKPTGLTATAGGSSVKLAWEDPSNFTIEKYQLLQLQEAKLTAAAGDKFGDSVVVDGDTAAVGAYLDDDNFDNSGSAYVFVIQDWTDIPGSGAATTSHTVSSLTGDVDYTFQIRAVNGVGNSEASDSVGAIPAIGGEWSYETEVEPTTITAGGGVTATTTFRAKFQADQTNLSSLSARVNTDGSISSGSSTNELPHFGWATAADSYDDTTPLS